MPVPHSLLADLHITQEAFDEKKKTDTKLNQLHKEYEAKDKEVVTAENGARSDEDVNKLRKERALIKEKIQAHVERGNH